MSTDDFVGFRVHRTLQLLSLPHLHDDAIEEFSSGAQLHHHVEAILAVEYFVQFDDVRVVHSLHMKKEGQSTWR